jgi:thiol-disulfide isomerase/thioredoxin
MKPGGRAAITGVLVIAAVLAVVVSRHTSPAAISQAAGAAMARPESSPAVAGTGSPNSPAADVAVLDQQPAPSVSGATQWLNTAPLVDGELHQQVVLYDFWTFECVNCFNTLPYVKAWQARYAADGLVIVGIHTPEFAAEADPDNVARFVAGHHITYPVALDPEWTIWKAWGNRFWPAFYLYDRHGLRLRHYGEGDYENTENTIRVLLGVDPSSPWATVLREPS